MEKLIIENLILWTAIGAIAGYWGYYSWYLYPGQKPRRLQAALFTFGSAVLGVAVRCMILLFVQQ